MVDLSRISLCCRCAEFDNIDLVKPYRFLQLMRFYEHVPMVASAVGNIGARPSVAELVYPGRFAANSAMSLR